MQLSEFAKLSGTIVALLKACTGGVRELSFLEGTILDIDLASDPSLMVTSRKQTGNLSIRGRTMLARNIISIFEPHVLELGFEFSQAYCSGPCRRIVPLDLLHSGHNLSTLATQKKALFSNYFCICHTCNNWQCVLASAAQLLGFVAATNPDCSQARLNLA